MIVGERKYYECKIKELEHKCKKLKGDNEVLTMINVSFKKVVEPLEKVYWKMVTKQSKDRDVSVRTIILWGARKILKLAKENERLNSKSVG